MASPKTISDTSLRAVIREAISAPAKKKPPAWYGNFFGGGERRYAAEYEKLETKFPQTLSSHADVLRREARTPEEWAEAAVANIFAARALELAAKGGTERSRWHRDHARDIEWDLRLRKNPYSAS